VRSKRVWTRLLGVEHTVVDQVEFDEDADALVASVRPARRQRRRCGICGRRSPGFDQGEGRRRWRALDLGVVRSFLEADAPRVACHQHGVVVARVPWARHDSGFTRVFEDTAAWLATHTSRVAVAELLRVAWRTVGRIVARVGKEAETSTGTDRLAGLRRIGIDEISHKRGHRYLTVVVDHDTGRLGMGGTRPRRGHPGAVLRPARRGPQRPAVPGQR
jgi:transposase